MYSHSIKEKGSYRWWLNITDRKHRDRFGLHIELNWRSNSYHLTPIMFDDDEYEWGFSFAFRPISFYFHVKLPPYLSLKRSRSLGISFHNGAVWWDLWVDPMGEYPCPYGKWRDGSFNFVDFLLGRRKYSDEIIEERDVLIPMPEKAYPATAKLILATWKRPRWFAESIKRVQIEMVDGGIPHEGKGENSWDCGHDATFGITTGECNSITKGVGILVGSVLSTRVKNGGWGDFNWTKEPEKARI